MFKIFSTYICWINIENERLEVSGAVRPLWWSLGVKGLKNWSWRQKLENMAQTARIYNIRLTFWRRNYFVLILAHLYIKCE